MRGLINVDHASRKQGYHFFFLFNQLKEPPLPKLLNSIRINTHLESILSFRNGGRKPFPLTFPLHNLNTT